LYRSLKAIKDPLTDESKRLLGTLTCFQLDIPSKLRKVALICHDDVLKKLLLIPATPTWTLTELGTLRVAEGMTKGFLADLQDGTETRKIGIVY
jgi:hypothetical protein